MSVQSAKIETESPLVRRFGVAAALAGALALGGWSTVAARADDAARPMLLAQATSTDGASSEAADVKVPDAEGKVDVEKLMAAEELPDVVIGDKDAPVTIVEYASLTCSHCRDFHQVTYPAIKKDFIDTGKAKLIIREFPFDPRALAAFMLARCAGDDAKRTAMVDVLFDQQPQWAYSNQASAELLKISRLAGMSEEQFRACLNDKELQKKVVAVQQRGENDFGVSATPTFFVNGDKYAGALEPAQMAAVIKQHM